MKTIQYLAIAVLASMLLNINSFAQQNVAADSGYFSSFDSTKIYYEIYGHGKPLVLLHGDLYGDISEYGKLIPVLQKSFKVIAIETRGHGKSWIGKQTFSYQLFASLLVLRLVSMNLFLALRQSLVQMLPKRHRKAPYN